MRAGRREGLHDQWKEGTDVVSAVLPDTRERSLASIKLLVNLPPDELVMVEQRCRWWRFAPGEQIIDRDSDNRDVFFVVGGQVRIVNFSTSGREIAYATIEPGSYFGEGQRGGWTRQDQAAGSGSPPGAPSSGPVFSASFSSLSLSRI